MARVKKEDNSKNLLKELNIQKEAIVEEIKRDIKGSLYDEISNTIEYESKKTLEKMEKKIYKYKNKSIFKRNIIILIFLVIIIFETKILYDNNLLFGLNKKEETKEQKEELLNNKEIDIKEEKDLDWYIDNYSYLLDNIKTNLNEEDQFYLYEKDYNVESIKNSVKLNIAYQLLDGKIKNENGIIEIDEEYLKKSFEKVFSKDSYKSENFNNSCIQFIYNKELKKYLAIDTECDKNEFEIFRNIKNIYEEDNKIIIEVNVGLVDEEEKTLITINKKNKYDYSKENIEKLYVYEFVFKKENDNYYLNKINFSE